MRQLHMISNGAGVIIWDSGRKYQAEESVWEGECRAAIRGNGQNSLKAAGDFQLMKGDRTRRAKVPFRDLSE